MFFRYMFFFQMPYLPEFVFSHGDCQVLEAMFSKKTFKTCCAEDVEAYKFAFARPGWFP